MADRISTIKHLGLLLLVGIFGICLLIIINVTFNNLLSKLDNKTNNMEAKIQIGGYIVNDLNILRSDFYELATTASNNFGRKLIQERIQNHLTEIRKAVNILQNGGVYERTIQLNLVNRTETTRYITYTKEDLSSVSLEAIDLNPKLIEFERMNTKIITLLEHRDKLKRQKDKENFFTAAAKIKRFYKTTPSFFSRVIENMGRLVYEGEIELQQLQMQITKQKDSYVYLELLLVFIIILLMIIFAAIIAKHINKNNKDLHYFNQELNSKIKELESQEASTRGILDAQPNIIVVSNGDEMIDANLALVDFFDGYDSFEDFKAVHACICDYFEDMGSDEYIIDIDYPEGKWFEHILANEDTKYKVAMKSGKYMHYFTINAMKKYISDEIFIIIISLNDITNELLANEKLKRLNNNLEEIVEEKTKKLTDLNENLEERIKKEVQLNRDKDKKLIQQSRYAALGEMIANIAHQWRQPLSAISSTSSSIALQMDLEIAKQDDIKDALTSIDKYVNYLNETIEDFRAFFKKNKEIIKFNVLDILHNSLNITSAAYKDNDITISYDLEIEELLVEGYPNELSQALINVLNNAKDALLENSIYKKHVHIHTFETETCNALAIYDNAGGIDEKVISKIFDPYFTTKHQSQGTGIGLYMSKDIIEKNMKGMLSVENKTFIVNDKTYYGACFTISIPKSRK